MKNMGIYVHIPFCKHKCNYCDFVSYEGKENLIKDYIECLLYEIKEVGEGNNLDAENGLDELVNVKTIYIGGGTPSIIDSKYIIDIINTIKNSFRMDKQVEITIEINPGTCTKEKLQDYYNSGINRLSIGLQAADDNLLKQLGRIHNYNVFLNTYKMATKIGFNNINVDLMLGIPNQNMSILEDSINKVTKLKPQHISVYSLIVEEGTNLSKDIENGIYTLPEDEEERDMYWNMKKILKGKGFNHYEISNFAKPGFASKHNLDCWNQKEYMGFGAGAHSYTDDLRYSNTDSVEEYIYNTRIGKSEDNLIFHEKQDKMSKMKEYMILGLRKIEGVNCFDFITKFRKNPKDVFSEELNKLADLGLLDIEKNIKLTDKGIDLANIVWEEFI